MYHLFEDFCRLTDRGAHGKMLVASVPGSLHLLTTCLYQSVLEGYNGTVMAYGQTGTGKTFTLGRLGEEDCADRGIMVRAMEDILANVIPGEDTVTVSYLQVNHVLYVLLLWFCSRACSFRVFDVTLSTICFWVCL